MKLRFLLLLALMILLSGLLLFKSLPDRWLQSSTVSRMNTAEQNKIYVKTVIEQSCASAREVGMFGFENEAQAKAGFKTFLEETQAELNTLQEELDKCRQKSLADTYFIPVCLDLGETESDCQKLFYAPNEAWNDPKWCQALEKRYDANIDKGLYHPNQKDGESVSGQKYSLESQLAMSSGLHCQAHMMGAYLPSIVQNDVVNRRDFFAGLDGFEQFISNELQQFDQAYMQRLQDSAVKMTEFQQLQMARMDQLLDQKEQAYNDILSEVRQVFVEQKLEQTPQQKAAGGVKTPNRRGGSDPSCSPTSCNTYRP